MKSSEIKVGETYQFMGSENPARAHLAGQPFTVAEIRPVWRRLNKRSRKTKRFFNDDGVGARADELEPMDRPEIENKDCSEVISQNPGAVIIKDKPYGELRDFTEDLAPSPWGD
jgi:hypothetical protein